jgi:hypothetical protein
MIAKKNKKCLRFESLETRLLPAVVPTASLGSLSRIGLASQQAQVATASPNATSHTTAQAAATSAIDLSHWKLTLPTGKSGHADTISTSQLVNGYSSKYFYTGSDGATVFWTPVNGTKTPGSTYPRTELRETKSDGSEYNWKVTDGTATLRATLAINQVPSTGNVVVGQIHDNGSGGVKNQPLIMLLYKFDSKSGTGSLIAQVRSTPTTSGLTNYTLATGIKLNTKFSYQIQLKSNYTLSVQVNGVNEYSASVDHSWNKQGLYFKAGSYPHDSSGPSSEGAKVSFYALTATHV